MFDYAGTGDSDGDYTRDCSLESMVADIKAAHRFLFRRVRCNHLGLVCLGVALMPALSWMAQNPVRPQWLLAWAPLFRGQKYIQTARRQVTISQIIMRKRTELSRPEGRFLLDGFDWPEGLVNAIAAYDAAKQIRDFPPRNYWLDFTMTGRESPESEQLAAGLTRTGRTVETVVFNSLPFWRDLYSDQRQLPLVLEASCRIAEREARIANAKQ